MTIKLTKAQTEAFRKHAEACYPNEAVGVISNKRYKRLENISDSDDAFECDSRAFYGLKNVTALLHSHCFDPDSMEARNNVRRGIDERTPSVADVRLQKALDVPMGIVACDGYQINEPVWLGVMADELIGNPFIFHIFDCFTLVRNYYKQELNIEIVDRNDTEFEWWANDDGTQGEYLDHFKEDGWIEIDPRMIEPNDVLLMQYKSTKPNHIALYKDSGTIVHHMFKNLSCEAPYSRWQTYIVKVLRYEPQDS